MATHGDGPRWPAWPWWPPRDLTLRRGSGGDQGIGWAGKGATGRTAHLAFLSARGPPPGTSFDPITQDTSPKHGLFGLAANRVPVELTGDANTGAGTSRTEGAQQLPGPHQPGPNTSATGTSRQGAEPAPPAPLESGGLTTHYTNRGHQLQGGQAVYSGLGHTWQD
jgi:hypothetical protein